MFNEQEVAAIKTALKRNSKEHLENWCRKFDREPEDLLDQFDAGIDKVIPVCIYYQENDDYNELWKVTTTKNGASGKYYVRATEGCGCWYTVCDPLGYCERNGVVKKSILFKICDSEGNPIGYSSNVNADIPTLKQRAREEWNKIKDSVTHTEENVASNFMSMCMSGTTTLSINNWLLTYKDPELYGEEIKAMSGYDENWVMHCTEIGREAVSMFEHLGERYAIYKIRYKHDVCGVFYTKYYSGRYPFMAEYEPFIDFYASDCDWNSVGTMYPKSAAIEKVSDMLKDIYKKPFGIIRNDGMYNVLTLYSPKSAAEKLLAGDYRRDHVEELMKTETSYHTFMEIVPSVLDEYKNLKMLDLYGGRYETPYFNQNGKLCSY